MNPSGPVFDAAGPAPRIQPAPGGAGESLIYKAANWFELLDWRSVFALNQPIEIDLGCGKGAFLLWAAATYPQRNFLGVDRLLRRLRRIDRKATRGGLRNVRLVRIEAAYLVSKLIPEGSVSTYHILFPDPWPKRRHHARRLISPDFLAETHRTLAPDGVINCATDHAEYFDWIQQVFRDSGRFAEAEPAVFPAEARTDFEKEFVAAGQPVYRCRWLKR
ncbi:MAG TPA: tRNA (guanosine(46)-N7)-methyltransferase TrmB [Verrucomicrobiae bacterium]|nr:tRNA (guanosine(46)-N7)-methyltransferase TrmB [Verrucomicrobiae bacterium]